MASPVTSPTDPGDPGSEFDRQMAAYAALGVPGLHGVTDAAFADLVRPLRAVAIERSPGRSAGAPDPAAAHDPAAAGDPGRLPFVLVVPGAPAEQLMPRTRQGAHAGYVDMRPVDPSVFTPLPEAAVPGSPYLILDVDTGRQTLGMHPLDATEWLAARQRLPLTIDEGIAALLLNPGLLRAANCYQMPASRDGSKRIPSLWVTGTGDPRLGWCYERMPHTWLGSASCAARATA